MRELRFGSYSMVATVAGMPYFSRLKSIRRSFCLWPPPWWRMVMRPVEFRPPVRGLTESSGLCGLFVVRSSFTSLVWKRSVGVIGRNDLIGIVFNSRSEEHTSELQSLRHLVCRLLLEKKK